MEALDETTSEKLQGHLFTFISFTLQKFAFQNQSLSIQMM